MHVRGAGLIGASAAYGIYLATLEAAASHAFDSAPDQRRGTTEGDKTDGVNLSWADRSVKFKRNMPPAIQPREGRCRFGHRQINCC